MVTEGQLMWTPSEAFAQQSAMEKYMGWVATKKELHFDNYEAMRQWSVDNSEDFWASIWEYFQIHSTTGYKQVLDTKQMPGCKWFEDSSVNYAEHILRSEVDHSDDVALHVFSERNPHSTVTWGELARRVRKLATGLRAMGIKPGDVVVSYMPNTPETIVAFLAAASIGAIWSSSAPEFGVKTVIDRFAQIKPKALFVCDGYLYNGKEHDRDAEVKELVAGLPTLNHVICAHIIKPDCNDAIVDKGVLWDSLFSGEDVPREGFEYAYVPYDHPLWVLFSSGTTGLPKAIAQTHVGIITEHYKLVCLHMGLTPESVMFFYTTAGWMMWNVVVSSLLGGGSVVLYDGNPLYPSLDCLWKISEEAGVTYFGASASYLQIVRKSDLVPKDKFNLKINAVLTGGSPVGPELFEWFYGNVAEDCWFSSQSGGTETCTCLVTAVPTEPVYAGEIQARGLGIDLHAWDGDGNELIDEVGELVMTSPFPSMPIYFCNDEDNQRYHEAYFDVYPDVWRHGDLIKINQRGGVYIYGRSDSTLNRFGVRLGSAEVYHALEHIPAVADSMVVCCELPQGGFFMPLFVVLQEGETLNDDLKDKINSALRVHASPRHVPDNIFQVSAIPYTLTGKKLEVPVRKLIMGWPLAKAASRDAMNNPSAIDVYADFANSFQDYMKSGEAQDPLKFTWSE